MSILNLLFPRRCVSCGKIGQYFCPLCQKKISLVKWRFCPACHRPSFNGAVHARCLSPYSLDGLFIGAHYSGPVKKAIHLIKYRFVSDLVNELTSLLFSSPPAFLRNLDFLVPVPLHFQKERERGFNQSLLISLALSEMINLPVKNNLLKRVKATKPQFGLKVGERKSNIRRAFRCLNPEFIKNKKIGLVDDVATTLSTLKECGRELKIAQAESVWAIVLAHGN
ncbi:hypothetical protein A2153_02295 [Candidatus Gottesmanbacteria bacterium RBG_16_38_7b]|uniref:Double zinc ribbon domain-containing protein n=1 Tax=Candidatus Gottesmanbacteria bacterium RBG_16_38_7b TaxID=1798372 RepID=A0A1F5YK88_9BACT|nr:MAG: hypothetical protein A2153_02295 [Candidatus Gottesmanbacteria bacterium RBG_16_38_7b]